MKIPEERLAKWVMETCLMFGAEVRTALKVAELFIAGLRNEGYFD